MKHVIRFSIAVLLVGFLALIAAQVWASPGFQGSVPPVPASGSGKCPETIDMGTALFNPLGSACTISVEWIGRDTGEYADPPEGLACLSDVFEVVVDPSTTLVEVCYAYPPDFEEKSANIYKLNEEANPQIWVEIPGNNIGDGVICVTSSAGYFALIGTP